MASKLHQKGKEDEVSYQGERINIKMIWIKHRNIFPDMCGY